MTPFERMTAALGFDKPDRVPVFLNNTYCVSRLIGATVSQVTLNADKLAEALVAGYRFYGYDGVRVGTDVTVEAEAMGCRVVFPDDDTAAVTGHVLSDPADMASLKMPDPRRDGRMPLMLDATSRVAREVGDEAFIFSLVMGPMNMASQLMGVSDILVALMDEPEAVEKLLDFCAEATLAFGRELVKAGAHGVVMGEAICSVSMLGPNLYRDHVLPVHKRIIDEFARSGIANTAFHICGDIEAIIGDVSSTGVTALDIDSPVDMARCRERLGKKTAFIGNVSPTLLLSGTPDEAAAACRDALSAKDGLGLVLGAGCTMARDTPKENIQAMVTAAKTFGRYPA